MSLRLVEWLPAINAVLNATSGVLVGAGVWAIRARRRALHRLFMQSAVLVSCAFLACYLTRVALTGTHRYPGTGWARASYLAILVSHTSLAMITVPLVLLTLARAWRSRFDDHKRIARWTFPVWLYVSVTGVLVYLMLYRFV